MHLWVSWQPISDKRSRGEQSEPHSLYIYRFPCMNVLRYLHVWWPLPLSFNYFLPDCEKSGVTLDYLQKLHEEYLKFIQVMRLVQLFYTNTKLLYITSQQWCYTYTSKCIYTQWNVLYRAQGSAVLQFDWSTFKSTTLVRCGHYCVCCWKDD